MAIKSIPAAVLSELAPTGRLRAGINFQNQLLTTIGPNGQHGGVAVEFACELALRLNVPVEIVPYPSAGSLANSVSSDAWDISVLAEDPERAKVIEFATPLTEVESTYLVPAGSRISSIAEVDREGVRIVALARSAFDLHLSRTIKNAQLVQIEGMKAAEEHFLKGGLEALAGLRPGLLEIAPTLPGSRVLDGHFTVIRHTIGIPQGRPSAAAYLRDLVEDVKASGLVAQWIAKWGVKGLAVAPVCAK